MTTEFVERWATARNWVIALLLGLATVHCVQSIFVVNVSYLDLKSYSNGTERMPFQGRVAMMPVGRWAGQSRAMQQAAAWIKRRIFHARTVAAEVYTPEKIAFLGVALGTTLLSTLFVSRVGWRLMPSTWWLPPAFFVFMLYTTYAARCDAEFWYPYDLPHFALFGIAAVCILQGLWPAAFCLFLVDLPMRETSVYLIFPLLALGYARKRWTALPWASVMFILWLIVHRAITHRFSGNESVIRILGEFWFAVFHNPYKWPQLMSAFGFLAIPFCWGWRYLTRDERLFVYGAIPGIFVTALYGVWIETRIWDEWLLPMAVLLSLQATRAVSAQRRSDLVVAESDALAA